MSFATEVKPVVCPGGRRGGGLIAPAFDAGFKPTTRAQVLGDKCWTAPVLANGFIFCRNGRGEIAAVDARKK